MDFATQRLWNQLRVSPSRDAHFVAVALLSASALFASVTSRAAPSSGHHRRWYVSATASAGGDGTIHSPFDSLAAAEQASSPGDTIVIEASGLDVPPLDGGIALKPGQSLLGSACICGWVSGNGEKFLTVGTNP